MWSPEPGVPLASQKMMMRMMIALVVVAAIAAGGAISGRQESSQQGVAPTPVAGGRKPIARIQVRGTAFVRPDGSVFEWRGITAFRLVELVAAGREAEAAAYMDWAARNQITVLRVLVMARHLFSLSPEQGQRALPRMLTLAADRGLHVEVVALADSAEYAIDVDEHVKAVGRIAAAHPNAFLEIANEPFHQTQHPSLHDRATLERLARLVPSEVVVAYGSHAPEESGGGDYVTVHMPRGPEPWGHVLELAAGRRLVEQYGRPVVSDEPIGAAAAREPGRRDNSPERFRAAALLTRMTGMHATFHYEGGLQARIPAGVEEACFQAWREAWTLLPAGIETGVFTVATTPRGALFETRLDGRRWMLGLKGATVPSGLKTLVKDRESVLASTPLSTTGS
jgi:hypothetical protein